MTKKQERRLKEIHDGFTDIQRRMALISQNPSTHASVYPKIMEDYERLDEENRRLRTEMILQTFRTPKKTRATPKRRRLNGSNIIPLFPD